MTNYLTYPGATEAVSAFLVRMTGYLAVCWCVYGLLKFAPFQFRLHLWRAAAVGMTCVALLLMFGMQMSVSIPEKHSPVTTPRDVQPFPPLDYADTLNASGQISTAKPAAVKNQVVTRGDFKFELLEARVEGEKIIFKLILINPTDNDKDFGIYMSAYSPINFAYDDFGVEYYLMSAVYGNKIIHDIRYTTKKLIAGTSMNLELYFENEGIYPKNATEVTLLTLKCTKGYGTSQYKVEFRNIPLKKE